MRARRPAVLLAAIAVLGACTPSGQDVPEADSPLPDSRTEQVAGVTVDVPDAWTARQLDVPDSLVDMALFTPGAGRTGAVQVIVACGEGDADLLVTERVREPREGLVATDAENAVSVEVEGLDSARRAVVTYGLGRDDDANTLRVAGLYGAGGGALVLVEYSDAYASFRRSTAIAVLETVTVDTDALADSCA